MAGLTARDTRGILWHHRHSATVARNDINSAHTSPPSPTTVILREGRAAAVVAESSILNAPNMDSVTARGMTSVLMLEKAPAHPADHSAIIGVSANPLHEGLFRRLYTKQHKHYCGIDLHTNKMYLCILNQEGEILLHHNIRIELSISCSRTDRDSVYRNS